MGKGVVTNAVRIVHLADLNKTAALARGAASADQV
jgi:hypothetical protein